MFQRQKSGTNVQLIYVFQAPYLKFHSNIYRDQMGHKQTKLAKVAK